MNSGTHWMGLIFMFDAFAFVAWYALMCKRKHIATSALDDKIILTMLFSSFVGIIKYALLCKGIDHSEEHIQVFTFIQDSSLMVIATCLGLKMHQKLKDLKPS